MEKKHWTQINNKIVALKTAQSLVRAWQEKGEKVVFTNGCFDILHKGHVTYLAKSADLGQRLVIGLNSDSSVKTQNKSPERPINDEVSRATLLAALAFTDIILIYDDPTPIQVIQKLSPDVLVKGADYDATETDSHKKTYIVGSDFVRSNGGEVKTIALEAGFSTTKLVAKIRKV